MPLVGRSRTTPLLSRYISRLQVHQIHRTLRVTPAMAARVTDQLWQVSDLVALTEPKSGG
jgi:hypothetical protein